MSSVAASSAASEREESVFTAASGLVDSSQVGEAVAAFIGVRHILHRHGDRFRRRARGRLGFSRARGNQ